MAVEFTAPATFQVYRTDSCFTVYLKFENPDIPDLQLVAPPVGSRTSKGNHAMGHDTLASLRQWAAELVKTFPAVRPDLAPRGVYEMVSNHGKEVI